jgi:SpoVK/Ycf46/Vps4 family AAA+-type ATPase
MAAADQIKGLIKSFTEGDDDRFYATAMQIAASEARKGHRTIAEELKKLIDAAKKDRKTQVAIKRLPVNAAQKELNDLLELIQPKVGLKDMVLDKNIRHKIQRVLDEQKQFDLLRQNNLFPRKKLLLSGPPGCGKTMSAHVIAYELGLPLFIIRLDGLMSRYMGESIAKLRLVFDAMEDFRAVYLFDEFDSIGTTRGQGNDVGEIKRVLNSFLLQIEKDDSNSIVIAATNIPETLDKALFRRFDDIITYPLPDEKQILEFYKKQFVQVKKSIDLPFEKLAKESIGLSFADIEKVTTDFIKDILIYGLEKADTNQIFEYINTRKKPY